jgi:hypothetical protein
MTYKNGEPLPADLYDTIIKERRRNNMIYLGLSCMLIVGLLFIAGYPADALPFNQSIPGERNTEDRFTFTMHNVSGQEDVTHHITVYGSKLLRADEPYPYWSEYFGQTLNQTPEKGKRWLFVWVEDWIEGTPTWPYDSSRFNAWIWGNTTAQPEPVQMQDIKPKQGLKLKPAIIQGVTYGSNVRWRDHNYYGDPYGWRDGIEMPYIQTGKSNSWSGWIKYQVPGNATLEDIQVSGWFLNHGTCYWNLVPRSFVQVEPTSTPAPTAAPVREVISRTSDRPGAAVIDGRQRG